MRGKGFGKSGEPKSRRAKEFIFNYKSSDQNVNIVKIQALSREEAAEQFQAFVRDLEFALRVGGEA
jgi:hypothetical protein